jgi:aminopeptidase C
VLYVNVPIEEMLATTTQALRAGPVWFGADIGKDSDRG